MFADMSSVTQILASTECGEPDEVAQFLPLVYGDLRKLAKPNLARNADSRLAAERDTRSHNG